MKVKELIEKLQKQDPEDEIHIIVNHCKIGESIDENVNMATPEALLDCRLATAKFLANLSKSEPTTTRND